jgi:hypothetical protein
LGGHADVAWSAWEQVLDRFPLVVAQYISDHGQPYAKADLS